MEGQVPNTDVSKNEDVPKVEVERFRTLTGPLGTIQKTILFLIPLIGFIFVLDIPGYLGYPIPTGQYMGIFFALVLAGVFLVLPPTKRAARDRVPFYDLLFSVLGLVVGLYLAINYQDLLIIMGILSTERLVLAAIAMLLVLEAVRRVAGPILTLIGVVFILYAAYGDKAPGDWAGASAPWDQLINYLYVDTNGLLGLPISVTSTTVLSFVLFGGILNAIGAGEFFTQLATRTLGKYRGGAAKVAVGASSLFGTLSGSAVSNVVVSGNFTIPMMKNTGYKPHVAGAVEAVASTGGQIMPPVMGAAAFLIAQFLAIPYREVAIAAIVPAVLYYICLFVQIDLEAARHNLREAIKIKQISSDELTKQGLLFFVPLLVLIYLLFIVAMPEAKAGVGATILAIVLGLTRTNLRKNPGWIVKAFVSTGRVLLDIGVVVALAGIIIGCMQISGLAFLLSNALIGLAGGNVFVLLVLTAIFGIILGMGMPTAAVYILLAVMVCPALIQMGLDPLGSHLFVFYFGMLSMITPPVCLAAFTAAALAKAGMWRTAFEATRLGGVAYIIPFMFVLAPSLLLRGNPVNVTVAIITAIIGTVLLAIALVGFLNRELNWGTRALFLICGVTMILPPGAISGSDIGWYINLAGTVVGILLLVYEWRQKQERPVPSAAGTESS
jgi:TRAP transporter 4TM/12TM fusion protein